MHPTIKGWYQKGVNQGYQDGIKATKGAGGLDRYLASLIPILRNEARMIERTGHMQRDSDDKWSEWTSPLSQRVRLYADMKDQVYMAVGRAMVAVESGKNREAIGYLLQMADGLENLIR